MNSPMKFEETPFSREKETEKQFVLTPEEKRRFEELCAQWNDNKYASSVDGLYLCSKALYEISQMGEKILPTLLFSEDEVMANLRSDTNTRALLESITSPNTAALVLRAIQEKKIDAWSGARTVTKGGKEYVDGLGQILDNIEPGEKNNRSDQIRLAEALSMTGDDRAVPFLKKFLEKAEKNSQYGTYPVYWFKLDVNEILKALLRINTPHAMEYIRQLSASDDQFIRESAKMALGGELSVPELKFDVIKPPEKPEAPQKNAGKEFSPQPSPEMPKIPKSPEKKAASAPLSPEENLIDEVRRENSDLLPFVQGKLGVSQSLTEVFQAAPLANYIRIAELLEGMKDPEHEMRAGFLMGQYFSFVLGRATTDEKIDCWSRVNSHAKALQDRIINKSSRAFYAYHQSKELLFSGAVSEKIGLVRKLIARGIVDLASDGNDREITEALSQIIRKARGRAREGKLRLDASQEFALRALFKLDDADANDALAHLLISKEIDPRLKKLCLRNLVKKEYFKNRLGYENRIGDMVRRHGKIDSRKIPWDEFFLPLRIMTIPDKELRGVIAGRPLSRLVSFSLDSGQSIAEMWRGNASNLSPELFVVVWNLCDGDARHLKAFDELLGEVKSDASREAYLFSLAYFAQGFSADGRAMDLFRQIFSVRQKEGKADSVLRIVRSLVSLQNSGQAHPYLDRAIQAIESRENLDRVAAQVENWALGEFAGNIYGKRDVPPVELDHLRTTIGAMEDPYPFFLYAAGITRAIRYSTRARNTRDLYGEMFTHLDPPEFQQWKAWRYNCGNPIVAEQVGFLNESQLQEYARDRFVEAGELVVSVSSSEKGRQIRDAVAHSFLHQEHLESAEAAPPFARTVSYLRGFFENCPPQELVFEDKVRAKLASFNDWSEALADLSTLSRDESLFARAQGTLEQFQRKKQERKDRLLALGFRGNESEQEVEGEIAHIRRALTPTKEEILKAIDKEGAISKYSKLSRRLEYFEEKRTRMAGGRLDRESRQQKKAMVGEVGEFENQFRKKLGRNFRRILTDYRRLASLSTLHYPELDPDFAEFLKRRNLTEDATKEETERGRNILLGELAGARESSQVKAIEDFLGQSLAGTREIRLASQNIGIARNILRLTILTPRLIAFDRIAEEVPKKSMTLSRTLEDLRNKFADYPGLVSDFGDMGQKLKESSAPWKKEKMAIVVTDHPLVSLTIGAYPYGAESCQKYSHGSEVLLSYVVDALSKICVIVDLEKLPEDLQHALEEADDSEEKMRLFNARTKTFLPAIVARRILKVVKGEKTGAPHIFLEPVYTAFDRESMTQNLDTFAKGILALGLGLEPIKGALRSDENQGKAFMVRVGPSRNRTQYEDGATGGPGGGGAGIGEMEGSYTMPAKFLE